MDRTITLHEGPPRSAGRKRPPSPGARTSEHTDLAHDPDVTRVLVPAIPPIKTADTTYSIAPLASPYQDDSVDSRAENTMECFTESKDTAPVEIDESFESVTPVRQAPRRRSDITLNLSSLKEADLITAFNLQRDVQADWLRRFEEENKGWDKLKTQVTQKVNQSTEIAAKIVKTEDCRRLLHGNRRSAYLGPPSFGFSSEEVMDDVLSTVDRMQNAVTSIVKVREQRALLKGSALNSKAKLGPGEPVDDLLAKLEPRISHSTRCLDISGL